jgi:hypothetical protein
MENIKDIIKKEYWNLTKEEQIEKLKSNLYKESIKQ